MRNLLTENQYLLFNGPAKETDSFEVQFDEDDSLSRWYGDRNAFWGKKYVGIYKARIDILNSNPLTEKDKFYIKRYQARIEALCKKWKLDEKKITANADANAESLSAAESLLPAAKSVPSATAAENSSTNANTAVQIDPPKPFK